MTKPTSTKKEKRVKAWAAIQADELNDYMPDSYLIDIGSVYGDTDFYAVFRLKRHAHIYAKSIGLKVVPCTIIYQHPKTTK